MFKQGAGSLRKMIKVVGTRVRACIGRLHTGNFVKSSAQYLRGVRSMVSVKVETLVLVAGRGRARYKLRGFGGVPAA